VLQKKLPRKVKNITDAVKKTYPPRVAFQGNRYGFLKPQEIRLNGLISPL